MLYYNVTQYYLEILNNSWTPVKSGVEHSGCVEAHGEKTVGDSLCIFLSVYLSPDCAVVDILGLSVEHFALIVCRYSRIYQL